MRLTIIIAATAFLASSAGAASPRVLLTLGGEAYQGAHGDLRLSQLARIETQDPSLAGRIGGMPLQVVGATGATIRVDRRQLQAALEWGFPQLRGRITWRGAESLVLGGIEADDRSARIDALAIRSLHEWVSDDAGILKFRKVSESRPRVIPGGNVQFEAAAQYRGDRRNPVCAPVAIRIEGRLYETVAPCFLASGLSLGSGVNRVSSEREPSPPLIRARQEVKVILQMPEVSIETTGVALWSGAVGKTIKVLNPRSQGQFMGVVTQDSTVTVSNF